MNTLNHESSVSSTQNSETLYLPKTIDTAEKLEAEGWKAQWSFPIKSGNAEASWEEVAEFVDTVVRKKSNIEYRLIVADVEIGFKQDSPPLDGIEKRVYIYTRPKNYDQE